MRDRALSDHIRAYVLLSPVDVAGALSLCLSLSLVARRGEAKCIENGGAEGGKKNDALRAQGGNQVLVAGSWQPTACGWQLATFTYECEVSGEWELRVHA